MRGEHHHSLRIRQSPLRTCRVVGVRLSARPSADDVLKVVEHLYIDLAGRAFLSNQITHSVVVVVTVGELEDRLVEFLAQPEHGLADKIRSPVYLVCQPRRLNSGQVHGCSPVNHNVGVAVLLEIGSGNHLGNFAFDDLLDLRRAALSPCKIIYLSGFQYGGNTHSDCVVRYVIHSEELAGGGNSGSVVEVDLPCPGVVRGAWLVHGHVSCNHNINSARLFDFLLETLAVCFHIVPLAAVNVVDILLRNVYIVDQAFLEKTVMALKLFLVQRIVVIHSEYLYILEAQLFFFNGSNKVVIYLKTG